MTVPHPEEPQIPHPEEESSQDRAARELSLFQGRRYEDDTRQRWDRRIFNIKLDYLDAVSKLGLWSVRAVVALIVGRHHPAQRGAELPPCDSGDVC